MTSLSLLARRPSTTLPTVCAAGVRRHSHKPRKRVSKRLLPIEFDDELKELFKARGKASKAQYKLLSKEIRTVLQRRKRKAWKEFCQRGVRDKDGRSLWNMFSVSQGVSSGAYVDLQKGLHLSCEVAETFEAAHHIRSDLNALLRDDLPCAATAPVACPVVSITPIELSKVLRRLPKKGSVGRDGVSNLMRRQAGPRLTAWLSTCINASLSTGSVASAWMDADIRPLRKPTGGYRPSRPSPTWPS